MLSATVTLQVQDLPDNEMWFVNAQAWHNYWSNLSGTVELEAATTTIYTPVQFVANSYTAIRMNVDGNVITLPPIEMVQALAATVFALNESYKIFRTELRNAGFITASQTN